MMETRDVRLSEAQVAVLLTAARRRRRELRKSIEWDSGTYHHALDRKHQDVAELEASIAALEAAGDAMARRKVAALRERLGMES